MSASRCALNKRLRALHPEIIARTEAAIAEVGGSVVRASKTDLLSINDKLVVSLVVARCQPQADGRLRWRIRFDPMRYQADVTLAVRLDAMNQCELDYYLQARRPDRADDSEGEDGRRPRKSWKQRAEEKGHRRGRGRGYGMKRDGD